MARAGRAWMGWVLLALACGKTHDLPPHATAVAGAGGLGGGGLSGAGTASGGAISEGGRGLAARCQLELDEHCVSFEASPPRSYSLRPDEYANTIFTLFGVEVDVSDLLTAPFERDHGAQLESVLPPGYLEAAKRVSERVAQALPAVCADASCSSELVATLAPRVWRGVVSNGEQAPLVAAFEQTAGTSSDKYRALLEALLSSARFCFRTEAGPFATEYPRAISGEEMASKLSYLFWADTPDDELLDRAAHGALTRPPDIEAEARRLLGDPRALRGLAAFATHFLGLDALSTRAGPNYPGWDPELAAAMKEETTRFLSAIVSGPEPTIESLYQANFSFLSSPLAALYGVEQTAPGWQRRALPAERRGLLTQASLLTMAAGPSRPYAAVRGLLVRETLRCESIPRVEQVHVLDDLQIDDSLPARERVRWLDDEPCQRCHQLLEPVGFAFERYDQLGRYREVDGTAPLDPSGQLIGFDGKLVKEFADVPELGAFLAGDPDAFACFAQQALRWSKARSGECSAVQAALRHCQTGDLRELLVAITGSQAFRFVNDDVSVAETERSCEAGGLSDCGLLAQHTGVDLATCEKCQGAACGTPGCQVFPCQGSVVIQGCCSDNECGHLAPFCGRATSPHLVCVNDDAL